MSAGRSVGHQVGDQHWATKQRRPHDLAANWPASSERLASLQQKGRPDELGRTGQHLLAQRGQLGVVGDLDDVTGDGALDA